MSYYDTAWAAPFFAPPRAEFPIPQQSAPRFPDAFEAAAYRQRQAAMPAGGRPEGDLSELLTTGLPNAYRYADNIAERAIKSAEQRAAGGDYNPAPFVETAANMIGFGGPAAMAGVTGHLGAAGGKGIRAYHGSPHDFDKFDLSKIGTGEGAQVYGHGLYFAENEAVAKSYKRPGPHSHIVPTTIDDVPVSQWAGRDAAEKRAADALARNPTVEDAIKYLQQDRGTEAAQQWLLQNAGRVKDANKTGKMYEVNINAAPEQFLDWDKPLTAAAPKQMQDAFNKIATSDPAIKEAFHKGFRDQQPGWYYHSILNDRAKTGDLVRNQMAATETLRDAGIPGIKYLDQGSRAAGDGSRNYVLFDDKLIDILRKYGIALPGAGAGMQMMGTGQPAPVSGM
jgi:hypothetical protein